MLLRDIHSNLLTQYNCKEVCAPSQSQGNVGVSVRRSHDRFGSSSDPTLNGTLHYPNPNDIDKSLNEAAADKIRKYRSDYNNDPPNAISFMPAVASLTGSSGN